MHHANDAIDEVRKAEFFRQGPKKRGLIKGKKWLLLSRWKNLTPEHRGELNRLFQINRRVFKVQGLPAEGKPGAVVDLHLRRSHDQLLPAVDGSTEVAAAKAVRETRRYPVAAPCRHRELLLNQGPHGSGRSREREHPDAHQPWARLPEPALPAAQGQATIGQQPRTPRRATNCESRVIREEKVPRERNRRVSFPWGSAGKCSRRKSDRPAVAKARRSVSNGRPAPSVERTLPPDLYFACYLQVKETDKRLSAIDRRVPGSHGLGSSVNRRKDNPAVGRRRPDCPTDAVRHSTPDS